MVIIDDSDDVCPMCKQTIRAPNASKLWSYPDGTTKRNVNRLAVQSALAWMIAAHESDDTLAAIEAYQELSNDAERGMLFDILNSKQKTFLRTAERSAAGKSSG